MADEQQPIVPPTAPNGRRRLGDRKWHWIPIAIAAVGVAIGRIWEMPATQAVVNRLLCAWLRDCGK